jgi:hypothetical protein
VRHGRQWSSRCCQIGRVLPANPSQGSTRALKKQISHKINEQNCEYVQRECLFLCYICKPLLNWTVNV